jgi:hypothetical protein
MRDIGLLGGGGDIAKPIVTLQNCFPEALKHSTFYP